MIFIELKMEISVPIQLRPPITDLGDLIRIFVRFSRIEKYNFNSKFKNKLKNKPEKMGLYMV